MSGVTLRPEPLTPSTYRSLTPVLLVYRLRHPLAVIVLAEDHSPGGSLQDAGHGDVDGLGDHLARVVHNHHGTVVQVGDALVVLLALLQDEDAHRLAWQDNGLEGVGQFVHVQYRHPLKLGNFVQVEVVGHDLGLVKLGQLDQLHIDDADLRKVFLNDLHLNGAHLLHALQDVEPASAAVALQRVGRVRHHLQLPEHELGHDQDAFYEASFADVRNPAVDDNAS